MFHLVVFLPPSPPPSSPLPYLHLLHLLPLPLPSLLLYLLPFLPLLFLLLHLLPPSSSFSFSSSSSQVDRSQILTVNDSNETYYNVQCERHFLTTFIIPDILLISAFVYGLYIFRWVQTEQLSTLTEAVSALIHKWPWLFHSLNTRV